MHHAEGECGLSTEFPKLLMHFFEEEFRKRYTMIGACDVNGFVKEATTRASFQTDTGLHFSS
jgi:hypothetical protein